MFKKKPAPGTGVISVHVEGGAGFDLPYDESTTVAELASSLLSLAPIGNNSALSSYSLYDYKEDTDGSPIIPNTLVATLAAKKPKLVAVPASSPSDSTLKAMYSSVTGVAKGSRRIPARKARSAARKEKYGEKHAGSIRTKDKVKGEKGRSSASSKGSSGGKHKKSRKHSGGSKRRHSGASSGSHRSKGSVRSSSGGSKRMSGVASGGHDEPRDRSTVKVDTLKVNVFRLGSSKPEPAVVAVRAGETWADVETGLKDKYSDIVNGALMDIANDRKRVVHPDAPVDKIVASWPTPDAHVLTFRPYSPEDPSHTFEAAANPAMVAHHAAFKFLDWHVEVRGMHEVSMPQSGVILDLMGGTGLLATAAIKGSLNRTVWVLDKSPAMLAVAEKSGFASKYLIEADVRKSFVGPDGKTIASGSVAGVMCHGGLALLDLVEVHAVFAEVNRILCPGGAASFSSYRPLTKAFVSEFLDNMNKKLRPGEKSGAIPSGGVAAVVDGQKRMLDEGGRCPLTSEEVIEIGRVNGLEPIYKVGRTDAFNGAMFFQGFVKML